MANKPTPDPKPVTASDFTAELPKWANWALLQAWFTKQSQGTPFPDEVRPALAEQIVERFAGTVAERGAYGTPGPRCFLVIATGGFWGKGKTLEEAAKNSKAGKSEVAHMTAILNAAEANVWVDSWGTANSDAPGAVFVSVGKSTIGGILSANK